MQAPELLDEVDALCGECATCDVCSLPGYYETGESLPLCCISGNKSTTWVCMSFVCIQEAASSSLGMDRCKLPEQRPLLAFEVTARIRGLRPNGSCADDNSEAVHEQHLLLHHPDQEYTISKGAAPPTTSSDPSSSDIASTSKAAQAGTSLRVPQRRKPQTLTQRVRAISHRLAMDLQ